jgi:hypothetical protein
MWNEAAWVGSWLLIVIGVFGTVLPLLPGVILVFAGAFWGAWLGDFQQVSPWIIGLLGALAIIVWLVDYVAGSLGAKRVNASPYAIWGAAIGTVLGVFSGFVGLLFMPFIGAALGEYLHQRNHQRALNVGLATWIGLMVGMVTKVVLVFTMVGIYVSALWL